MVYRLLCSISLVLWALASGPILAQENGHQPNTEQYHIGAEDILEIVVWQNPDVSRTVPVRPDGMISLPLVNDVQAAGLTPMDLREVLIQRLEDYVPNAEVSVIVTQVHSPRVSVLGEAAVGRYVLRSRTRVLDFLAQIGGLKAYASYSKITILRPKGDSMQRIHFNYKKAISANGDKDVENFYLEPGDIIVVPKSVF